MSSAMRNSRMPTLGCERSDHDTMIVLHHLERSRSQRIAWLLEELGTPYEIKRYKRDP